MTIVTYDYRLFKPRVRGILTKDHRTALKELKRNRDIMLLKPDKGMGIVVMNRKDYLQKMYSIVQDESKFQKLNLRSDPTEQTEKQINGLLKSMRDL